MAVSLGHGASGNKAPSQNSDINVTPFIDIMLVLLIIFMVALPPPTVNTTVNIPPQPINPPPPDPNNKPLFINLHADGSATISLGIGPDATALEVPNMDGNSVASVVVQLVPTGRDTKETFIRADFDAAYKTVMVLLDKLHEAGIKKLGFVGEDTSGG